VADATCHDAYLFIPRPAPMVRANLAGIGGSSDGTVGLLLLDPASASMTIGRGAAGIRGGTLLWPKHGSATQLGIRARTLVP